MNRKKHTVVFSKTSNVFSKTSDVFFKTTVCLIVPSLQNSKQLRMK